MCVDVKRAIYIYILFGLLFEHLFLFDFYDPLLLVLELLLFFINLPISIAHTLLNSRAIWTRSCYCCWWWCCFFIACWWLTVDYMNWYHMDRKIVMHWYNRILNFYDAICFFALFSSSFFYFSGLGGFTLLLTLFRMETIEIHAEYWWTHYFWIHQM